MVYCLEELFYETGHGVRVEFRFRNPDVVGGKHGFLIDFQQVEVGKEDAVGEDMTDVLLL